MSDTPRPPDWNEDWRRFGASAGLNPAQAYRRRLIRRLLEDAGAENARILDVGTGTGDLLAALAAWFPDAELAGVDVSRSGLEMARTKVPSAMLEEIDLTREAGEPPPGLAGWAEIAVCSEVLEHLEKPERALSAIRPLLAPGARLVVTVPGGPMSAFDRHIGHLRHYRAPELRELLESAGYTVERAAGAGFPSFNLYRLVVIARGARLIEDAAGEPRGLARIAMHAFDALLHATLTDTPWGWQTVAVARVG